MFSYIPPVVGGIATHTHILAKGLVDKGHEVHLISFNQDNKGEYEYEGIQVHGIGTSIDITGLYSVGPGMSLKKVRELLVKIDPDIIHFHHKTSTIEFFMEQLKSVVDSKIVNTIHTPAGSLDSLDFMDNFHYIHYKALSEELKKASDKIICVSDYNKNELVRRGINPDKIDTVRNGIFLEKFDKFSKEEAREKLGISQDKKIVLFVGRHSPEKGISFLISGFRKIKDKTDVEMIIPGEGKLTSWYKFLAEGEPAIKFVGYLSKEDLYLYYKAADIYVLPSTWAEPQAITLFEAMAAKLPIVTTRMGGSTELIEECSSGILIKPKDPIEIKEAVEKLLGDKELREKMGKNGYACVKSKYLWQNIIDETEKIYEGVLDEDS